MVYLAQNPIGRSTTQVAQVLSELPKRAALVRSGEARSVIHTDDTSPPVESDDLRERLLATQKQTREKYCRSKKEGETAMILANDEPQAKREVIE
jgi:hypothetical protein